jgi:hypothetical protein
MGCTHKSGVVAPIPSAWVDHVGRKDGGNNTNDDVKSSSEDDSLDLQSSSRDLSDERVADSADSELVHSCPHNPAKISVKFTKAQ